MMKRLENGTLKEAPKNEIVIIDGVLVGISNFDKYLEAHQDIANSLGFYEYEHIETPKFDIAKQYATCSYAIINNKIKDVWEVHDYTKKELRKQKSLRKIICKILPSWLKRIIWKVVVGE